MSKKSSSFRELHQLSFLDDSGAVRPDCVCRSVLLCYICQKPIPNFHPTLTYLAGSTPRPICKTCYENYKQTFDIGDTRRKSLKKSKKGGKK